MKKTSTSARAAQAARKSVKRTSKANSIALPADPKALATLKFSRLSGDDKFAGRLLKSGLGSVRQIASLPSRTLLERFDGKLTREEERKLYRTQQHAQRMMVYTADLAVTATLGKSPNGLWWPGLGGKKPKPELGCFCGCCGSIFSLKAYLFDLLDLLAHYWTIDLADVEALLQRSFSDFRMFDQVNFHTVKQDLICEPLDAPLPQVRIAAEVLEAYLGTIGKPLPVTGTGWKAKFVDGLLRLITPRPVQIAILSARRTATPPAPPKAPLAIAEAEAQANLPAAFAAALTAWKTRLDSLVLNLAGIDEAAALLSDYSQNFTGFAPDTLHTTVPDDGTPESPEERRLREMTVRFEQARDATVRQWLADYRDAARAATQKNVDTLEAGLFISLSSGPCRTTTRLQELVTSVQQIVENIRSGEIAALDRPDIGGSRAQTLREAVNLPLAEAAWLRLRDYETWLGTMYGWVYPENVLNPLAADLIDPTTQNTPLAIREWYLQQASGGSAGQDLIPSFDLNRLEEEAKTRALAPWKAAVDAMSVEVESIMGSMVEASVELLSTAESDLLFPLSAGKVLSQSEFFAEAHEWFSLLYNPVTGRAHPIFDQVPFADQPVAGETRRGDAWLNEPFDPISIANRRPGVWLRYTILAMVRNLIDWADDDFARGLPDTLQRAEERYELARKLLGAQELKNECETIILDIQLVIEELPAIKGKSATYSTRLRDVQSIAVLKQTANSIRRAVQGKGSIKQKRAAIERAIDKAQSLDRKEHPPQALAAEWQSKLEEGGKFEDRVFFQPDPGNPDPPMPEPAPGGGGRPPLEPFLPDRPGKTDRPFDEPVDTPDRPPPPPIVLLFCVPLNPILGMLDRQITTQLLKLNRCLDFIGEPQVPRVYGCDTYDAATGLINRPTSAFDRFDYATDQPRYRYNFLVDKARQYVEVAQRIGSLLLQALQNSDNEAFQQLKAEHAIELAGATVELRRLGQTEANHGVEIAALQAARADSQIDFWEPRGGDDIQDYEDTLSPDESESLALMGQSLEKQQQAADLLNLAVLPIGIAAGVGAGMSVAGAAATASGIGAPVGIPTLAIGIGVLAGTAAMLPAVASARQAEASALSQEASLASSRASYERRFEEWKNQFALAKFDAQIADLQEALASDRMAIADQEMVIAQLQLAHAREELRFLLNKTTNKALYDWMVRVLSRDYRALMQIAACVARMAQRALEFERQEPVRLIVGDYWNIAAGVLGAPGLTKTQRELGLLGAERLLTDLIKLDAFKVATEKRRQQISKTISLARVMPIEFVEFRRSGTMTFNTLMEWFDDDFQGHYLRLIKSVKVSILAIVPPLDGIHAMLQNTGESSVVVTEDGLIFDKKRATRNFGERISLDSPVNESGLFILSYDDPMLLPFEGLGVETQWTLELPRGNNRFNFDTIADVFLTIEYTAEHSQAYEQQQREERKGAEVHDDTAVPLRLQFPDLWYHLKNHRPDAAGAFAPFPFKFRLPRTAFAPNLEDPVEVAHLTLLVSGNLTSAEQDLLMDGLTITHSNAIPPILHQGRPPRPGPPAVPGDSTSAFGHPLVGPASVLFSTRGNSANGLPANPAIGTAAPDEWTIELAASLFPAVIEKISDLLFVATVRGTRF